MSNNVVNTPKSQTTNSEEISSKQKDEEFELKSLWTWLGDWAEDMGEAPLSDWKWIHGKPKEDKELAKKFEWFGSN